MYTFDHYSTSQSRMMYLGSVDQSPGIEQAKPVLVAVVEAGAVGLPIYIGVVLQTHTHTLCTHDKKQLNLN